MLQFITPYITGPCSFGTPARNLLMIQNVSILADNSLDFQTTKTVKSCKVFIMFY